MWFCAPFCGRAVLGRAGFVLHLVCGPHSAWLPARGRGRRLAVLWRRALGGVLVALSVYTGFTPLWGLTYYARETIEEQAGVTARPVTVDELEATTRLFMEKLNAAAPLAPSRRAGRASGDTQAILTHPAHCTTHWSSSTHFVLFPPSAPSPCCFPCAERAEFLQVFSSRSPGRQI